MREAAGRLSELFKGPLHVFQAIAGVCRRSIIYRRVVALLCCGVRQYLPIFCAMRCFLALPRRSAGAASVANDRFISFFGPESELARLMLLNWHRSSGSQSGLPSRLRNPAIPGVM
ncbi:hypothetical protein IB267_21520 [Ensifer sp. ENS09]|uniref:hypothetical protein n=1 Tax=Ensifer sp. ENS09 TaxID=2769263 RepID=UPI001785B4D1|nr:hypothetical protein [Ensifer sp. ENS09]MBD9650928.1 hypothetical protein [Ensifer sp. ENS09]